jgi:hypothetical protein
MKETLYYKSLIDNVMTAAEAAKEWKLSLAAVRNACLYGKFKPYEARKSAGTWLITKTAMERVYGLQP